MEPRDATDEQITEWRATLTAHTAICAACGAPFPCADYRYAREQLTASGTGTGTP